MFVIKAKEKRLSVIDKILIISEIRSHLLNDEMISEILDEYNLDRDFILGVPISFEDLDVSAKTVNAEIKLSNKLLKKSFDIILRYAVHEFVHAAQHATGKKELKTDKAEDYLDKETEIEAFQYQIKFDADNRGEEEAEEYVDELLEYHDIGDGERKEKKKELMEEVE